MKHQKKLIRGARIVAVDHVPDMPSGNGDVDQPEATWDVLIDGSEISAIKPSIADDGDCQVIEAKGMVLMPGMIDTHIHMWEAILRGRVVDAWSNEYYQLVPPMISFMEQDDVYVSTYTSALEYLNNGVTTVRNYSHGLRTSEHADVEIRALQDAGIRAEFCYELHDRRPDYASNLSEHEGRLNDARRVHDVLRSIGNPLFSFGVGLSEFAIDDLSMTRKECEFARELGGLISFHNNVAGEVRALEDADLLGPDVLAVHGNFNDDDDWRSMARCEAFLSFQPQTEMLSGRRSLTMVARAYEAGVRLCLGIDVPALTNLGLLNDMRVLYLLQRYLDGTVERSSGRGMPVIRRTNVPHFSAREIVRFGTFNGARSMGLGDTLGRVAVGQQADLVLLAGRPWGISEGDACRHVVMCSSYADIDTVLVAGEIKKRGGVLVDVDVERVDAERESTYRRIMSVSEDRRAEVVARHMVHKRTSPVGSNLKAARL